MNATPTERVRPLDALKTYRYLRAGMIGAVALLGVSIWIEHSKAPSNCWQRSISAYYYTPVRAVFVGSMLVVGFALIVYKGRGTLEDFCLNMAGMLAPVVAVAPTMDVGKCYSLAPEAQPKIDGVIAPWVIANVSNNIKALLILGTIGGVVALGILVMNLLSESLQEEVERGTVGLVVATFLVLLGGWLSYLFWNDFYERAHGWAAVSMFVFLFFAIVVNAVQHRNERSHSLTLTYSLIAGLMAVGGLCIWRFKIGGTHQVGILEAHEIVLFATYWIVQTVENWREKVRVRSDVEDDVSAVEFVDV